MSVCGKEKKKYLLFKEKEPFGQERKNQFKQGKIFNSKVLKLWVLLGEADRPIPQQGTSARAQSSGNYTMPEFNISQYVFFLSDYLWLIY